MTSLRAAACGGAVIFLVALSTEPGFAQGRRGGGPAPGTQGPTFVPFDRRNADPMAGPVISGAPFSADATTTVVQTLGDGTRIEQHSTAKFYRDGMGRVRREQTILGLDTLNPSATPQTRITFDTVPGDNMPYVLDPVARTARQMPRALAAATFSGYLSGAAFRLRTPGVGTSDAVDTVINFQGLAIPRRGVPNDLRAMDESLGTRQIDGMKATGRRTTTTIPQGRIGNDRAIQIVDELWDSPELGILISSRYSDPRTGVVEYKLTNVVRGEPRADLFAVPPDYTVVPALPTPGVRGGRNPGATPPPAPGAPPPPR